MALSSTAEHLLQQAQQRSPQVPSQSTSSLTSSRRRRPAFSDAVIADPMSAIVGDEELSLLSKVGHGALSGASMLGNLLDLPSSMVRDTLALKNPFDQLLSPLSHANIGKSISGRDLLTQYGLADKNKETGIGGWLDDPMEAVRDIAGFGVEAGLDIPGWGLAKAAFKHGSRIARPAALTATRVARSRVINPLRKASRRMFPSVANADPLTRRPAAGGRNVRNSDPEAGLFEDVRLKWKQLFHAPSGGAKTHVGQHGMELLDARNLASDQGVNGVLIRSLSQLKRAEKWTDNPAANNAAREMLEHIRDMDPAIAGAMDEAIPLTETLRKELMALGHSGDILDDVIEHFPRRLSRALDDVYEKARASGSTGAHDFGSADHVARLDALKGARGGSTMINEVFEDVFDEMGNGTRWQPVIDGSRDAIPHIRNALHLYEHSPDAFFGALGKNKDTASAIETLRQLTEGKHAKAGEGFPALMRHMKAGDANSIAKAQSLIAKAKVYRKIHDEYGGKVVAATPAPNDEVVEWVRRSGVDFNEDEITDEIRELYNSQHGGAAESIVDDLIIKDIPLRDPDTGDFRYRIVDDDSRITLSRHARDQLTDNGDGTFSRTMRVRQGMKNPPIAHGPDGVPRPLGVGEEYSVVVRPELGDRYWELAKMVVDLPAWRETGPFRNHFMHDWYEAAMSASHLANATRTTYDTLGAAIRSNGVRFKSQLPGVGEYSKTLGSFLTSDYAKRISHDAVRSQVLHRLGGRKFLREEIGVNVGRRVNVAQLRMLDDLVIPDRVFDDLMAPWEMMGSAKATDTPSKMWSSMNNLFKAGVLTHPARYTRDLTSGLVRNLEAFAETPADALRLVNSGVEGQKLMQGRAVTGIADALKSNREVAKWVRSAKLKMDDEGVSEAVRQMYSSYHGDMPSNYDDIIGMPGSLSGTSKPGTAAALESRLVGSTPTTVGEQMRNIAKTFLGRGDGVQSAFDPLMGRMPKIRGVLDRSTNELRSATEYGPVAAGNMFGRYTDNTNRMTPFIHLLKKNVRVKDIARRVNDAQVDYSTRAFTPFERKWMKTVFPFYSFSSRQIPWMVNSLIAHPSGTLSQMVRAQRLAASSQPLPEHVSQTAAIPLGTLPDGTKRYIAGLGLMHEDPLAFIGSGEDVLSEIGSRLAPHFKLPVELATGESLFQRGPMGGRDLVDMDPTIGRIGANVSDLLTGNSTRRANPVFGSRTLEHVAANSPISRLLTSVRTITDPRKYQGAVPGLGMAANMLSGFRIADVSPVAQNAFVQQTGDSLAREIGARDFTRFYFPDEIKSAAQEKSPELAERIAAFEALQKAMEQKRQISKLAKQQASQ